LRRNSEKKQTQREQPGAQGEMGEVLSQKQFPSCNLVASKLD
jgi:hypothetical protein